MGTADTDIHTNPATQPGVLAPITRIGGGEVRVDAAAATTTVAWDSTSGSVAQPSLSFGFHDCRCTDLAEPQADHPEPRHQLADLHPHPDLPVRR